MDFLYGGRLPGLAGFFYHETHEKHETHERIFLFATNAPSVLTNRHESLCALMTLDN